MPVPTSPDPTGLKSARNTLSLEHVSKSFGAVRALSDVSFTVHSGEVHALVGENGAGKSTLLKIISGAHTPDDGQILIDGQPVKITSPAHAAQLGIGIIYQELSLIPWLSVAQNLFLGREHEIGRWIVSRRRMRSRARDILGRLGLDIDPDTPVALLGVATQQMVEIARALSHEVRFLLMDEPTASLTERETSLLFERIAALKADGVSIVYISHRLEEIPGIADRITVLRDGSIVHHGAMKDISLPQVVTAMVGRPLSDYFPARTVRFGEEILRVEPPSSRTGSRAISLKAGEVVGIAGLVGAGRTEWLWRLVGAASGAGESVTLLRRQSRDSEPGAGPRSRSRHGAGKPQGAWPRVDPPDRRQRDHDNMGSPKDKNRTDGHAPPDRNDRNEDQGIAHSLSRAARTGLVPERWQPAEGGARQMADARLLRLAARRADARHRRRRQAGDVSLDQ